MIDDFKIGFEIGILDLLKEDREFIFDFLSFIKEIKLVLLILRHYFID